MAATAAFLHAECVVTFNELNYNPAGESEDGEWLELHNQMGINVDLSGWRLDDGIDFIFPDGTVIPAGGYVTVAKTPGHPSLAGAGQVVGPYTGSLSNSGETITLLSSSDRVMDEIDYRDSGDWPVAADGSGVTLIKISPRLTSDEASHWTASPAVGGTPGMMNLSEPDEPVSHNLVTADAVWSFDDSGVAPAANWKDASFNDAGWQAGQGGFGTGGTGAASLTVTADLVERFRASDIAGATNGQTLTTWNDLALGDGVNQSATAGGNPTFVANATPSGHAAVSFDGNDEFRTAIVPGISGTSGFVYFAVVKANSAPAAGSVTDGGGSYLWDRDSSQVDPPLVSLKADGGRFGFQKRYDDNSNLSGPVSATPISQSQFQIVAIRRNPAANRFELWVDGTLEATEGDGGGALTPQPIVIARHSSTVTSGFDGQIAELLIYRDELSEADFQSVGTYLESRYGLDTAFEGSTVNTALAANGSTAYLRQEFTYNGDPSNTQIRLNATVADGAVFYLNGSELHRENMPTGTISHGTRALADVPQPSSTGFFPVPANALANGNNVLAASLHPASASLSTYFAATLDATETPPDPTASTSLVFNEISSGGWDGFFVEITNPTAAPIVMTGYSLEIDGAVPAVVPLPAGTLAPGAFQVFNVAALGQIPVSGDKLYLRKPGGAAVADARAVTNRRRGLSANFPGEWLFPNTPTPGAANAFDFESDIVINEICYQPPTLQPDPGTPPTYGTIPLVGAGATWRFNQSGENLGTSWAATAHSVGGNWEQGPSIIAYETNLAYPIATTLRNPSSNSPFVRTYYFETDFTLTAQQAGSLDSLNLTHLIDDGAVFYLNGVELGRFQMPSGTITSTTLASGSVGDADYIGPNVLAIPPGTTVAGTNRLSVEVHQINEGSSDISFSVEADGQVLLDPGVPGIPRRDSEEQWIELHNKGTVAIDLASWEFSEGIEYIFAPGTTLPAGGFIVVAKDPAALLSAHPGITVVGPFSGSLSGGGEGVRLRDAFGNPADFLRYVDGGTWPEAANGLGSTIELMDARSDNAKGSAWAASDELARTGWQTYSYRMVAGSSSAGNDGQWREFDFGLLEEGELLLDDITVIESPDGAAASLLQDGNFGDGDADEWRFLGNHRFAEVIPDPDNPANQVLHLRATGSTEHMHNHVETTLANGRSVTNGLEYEISFKARWLKGCDLLNTRLYFNRAAKTTLLERPSILGTPGAPNSSAIANAGPTAWNLAHEPVVPAAGQPVTVSARLQDPDGIASATLYYSVEGAPFASVPMATSNSSTLWSGEIPGQSPGQVVQFYLVAEDDGGATTSLPAAGPQSRAMFEVQDSRAATTGIGNIRIIMDPADQIWMHTPRNVMSNDRLPCTVIDGEKEVYYDAGVRIKGSERARVIPSRVGFNLGFPRDHLFRGVHRTVAIDRSEGQVVGFREILFDLTATSTGGVPAEFNDLCYVISPDPIHTSAGILQMARFGSEFLGSQFEDGEKGTVYEYELVYYPTTTDAEGYKLPQPDNVNGRDITSLGPDKEDYRWLYLTKNNQEIDDYSKVLDMAALFDLSGTNFLAAANETLDVDQWLRAMAYSCISGAGDSFFSNSNHNGQFYARPDGRMLYFPHDMDLAHSVTRNIFESSELQKLTSDPSNRRRYLGHLHDLCTTVFNSAWMAPWTTHFDSLVPGGSVFNDDLSFVGQRSDYILLQLNAEVTPVTFAITTNNGANFTTATSPVALAGSGWINVDEIRLAGSGVALPTTWTDVDEWQISLALSAGPNPITLEAYDQSETLVGTDSITITSQAGSILPTSSSLVVSEIFYNPPGSEETSEFVELLNITPSDTLDLTGTSFTDGITFTFPPGSTLAPGQRILLVSDQAGFEAVYGSGLPVVGTYVGNLSNSGETIEIQLADGSIVQSFTYDDATPWPVEADGDGYSLVLVAPECAPDHNLAISWRASLSIGGTPGSGDEIDYATWKAGYGNPVDDADPDGDGWTVEEEYAFGGTPVTRDRLGPGATFDHNSQTATLTIRRRAGTGQKIVLTDSDNLIQWTAVTDAVLIDSRRLPGSDPIDELTFTTSLGQVRQFFRFEVGE